MRVAFLLLSLSLAGCATVSTTQPDRGLPHVAAAVARPAMPADAAWNILRDISVAHEYVPGVTKVEVTTSNREGIGASRRIYQGEGDDGFDETVLQWEDGRGFLLRLHDGEEPAQFPMGEAYFRYAIEAEGKDRCKVNLSLSYEMRGGWLGKVLQQLVGGFVQSRIDETAKSLETYYERRYAERTGG